MPPYFYSVILMLSVILGGLVGYAFPDSVIYLKPIGTLFLNLILSCVIPLVFFCVASSITKFSSQQSISKTLLKALLVFLSLGLLAASYMLILVLIFPMTHVIPLASQATVTPTQLNLLETLPNLFSVSRFAQLFTSEHLLALIVFSVLIGVAAKQTHNEFIPFLHAAERVFLQVFHLIMKLAPIGFFAYFAGIIHDLGPQFVQHYLHVSLVYFIGAIVYFFIFFSLYIYLGKGKVTLKHYWQQLLLPSLTAIATCSSAASIPANYTALQKMNIPTQLAETLIPLGTIVHKQGSIMGGIIKIAFLYSVFGLSFTGLGVLISAIGISLLVGTVMGAIPSGGLLGELLILHVYGFDQKVLFMIATISIIIDAPATLLNVIGNTVAVVLLDREPRNKH